MARSRKSRPFFDVRLADIVTFLAVKDRSSVTAAARALGTTSSHVSKSLARLESQLGLRLLARSGRGVTLTKAALEVVPDLAEAAEALSRARRGKSQRREVTVAAPSYLLHAFVPALAAHGANLRVRGVQMGTGGILASLGMHQFEVALSTGERALPRSWKAEIIGDLRSGLFCMPALARKLGPHVSVETLAQHPFIMPVAFSYDQWEPMNDGCPLTVSQRPAGHEAPTISLALAIAARCPQLAFGPVIAAADFVAQRKLVEVPVSGWQVSAPLFLAVDIDRITMSEFKTMAQVARQLIAE